MKRLICAVILLTSTTLTFAQSTQPDWGYQSPIGPNQWGSMAPGYVTCQVGGDQSPLDIESGKNSGLSNVTMDTSLQPIQPNWGRSNFNVLFNGHTVQMVYDAGSDLSFEGQTFNLKQFHFHSPSEHILDGREYPLEAHFVHQSAAGTLVVGVFFEVGNEHPALSKIWQNTPAEEITVNVPTLSVDANEFLPADKSYFHYTGSLTTPPCTEGVKWIILKKPITASAEQIQFLQKRLGGPNNRPVQPLDGRMIGVEVE